MSLRKTALLSIASGLVFISLGGITSSTSFASSVTPTALRGTWYYSDVTGTYKLIITSKSISNQLGAAVLRNGKRISWIPNNSGQYFMRHTYLVD